MPKCTTENLVTQPENPEKTQNKNSRLKTVISTWN